ncbi:hypothetical protein KY308_02240 [Candidatus Woesearchaeota archaeon]|nr:hypothetical protein [Candidatus Woesearchaeota archaeon]
MGVRKINNKKGVAVFELDPKIYPIDVIHSAAYMLMDEAFIILDTGAEGNIIVELRKKQKEQKLPSLIGEFYDEMYNYSSYKIHSQQNKKIRELILKRALFGSLPKEKNERRQKK